jgi:hypothetical protein
MKKCSPYGGGWSGWYVEVWGGWWLGRWVGGKASGWKCWRWWVVASNPLTGVGNPPTAVGSPPTGVLIGNPPTGVGNPPTGVGNLQTGVGNPPEKIRSCANETKNQLQFENRVTLQPTHFILLKIHKVPLFCFAAEDLIFLRWISYCSRWISCFSRWIRYCVQLSFPRFFFGWDREINSSFFVVSCDESCVSFRNVLH